MRLLIKASYFRVGFQRHERRSQGDSWDGTSLDGDRDALQLARLIQAHAALGLSVGGWNCL